MRAECVVWMDFIPVMHSMIQVYSLERYNSYPLPSYQKDSWSEGITVQSFVCLLTLTACGSSRMTTKWRKNFPSVLFFLINITFSQVRINEKVFVIVVQIQFQIELFFSRAGAFCHMLTFYHWCHLDSFPWQCSDGRLLTHAEREENPYSTTCCLSVWQSSALTTYSACRKRSNYL